MLRRIVLDELADGIATQRSGEDSRIGRTPTEIDVYVFFRRLRMTDGELLSRSFTRRDAYTSQLEDLYFLSGTC